MVVDRRISVLVGPEGGWSDDEVRQMDKLGFIGMNLGERILRAETASMFAVGLISYLTYEEGTV